MNEDNNQQQGGDSAAKTLRIESDAPDAASVPAAPPSSLHSLYSIQAKIGGGGMGVVYLAKDLRLDRFVAIKRLNATANCDASLRHRFLNEAHAVASLANIHIVHIYALGEDEEGPYIAMEYVEGPAPLSGGATVSGSPRPPLSLEAHVAESGQYSLDEALELVIKLAKAIAYAHSCGVIHRDLKPSNILLDPAGEPKIIDFGLARLSGAADRNLTRPGEKLLSLGYGAPEQENDASEVDERADVYGLGGILFFAITGRNPRFFREQDIPAPIVETLVKALATDREQRWPSAGAFLEALTAVHSRTRIEQPAAKTTWRCKWCDTVNPVSIRFCAECGWDGIEPCPECGAENFVGMRFCARCGANIRVYESMRALLAKLKAACASGEFEKAVSLSGQTHGFEPAGPSGRTLLQQIARLGDDAGHMMARRDQLKELIPAELKSGNYERARSFISELRKLCGKPTLFEAEFDAIPEYIASRDFERATRAWRDGDLDLALEICDDSLATVAPKNPRFAGLRKMIIRRKAFRRVLRYAAAIAAVALAYMAALPPLLSAARPKPLPAAAKVFFRPAAAAYARPSGFAVRALRGYASLFDVAAEEFAAATVSSGPAAAEAVPDDASRIRQPGELASIIARHEAAIAAVKDAYEAKVAEWPEKYLADLNELLGKCREQGDFFGVQDVSQEIDRFSASGEWVPYEGTCDPLAELQRRHAQTVRAYGEERDESLRKAVAATLDELENLTRRFVKDGDMESASAVHAKIDELSAAEQPQQTPH